VNSRPARPAATAWLLALLLSAVLSVVPGPAFAQDKPGDQDAGDDKEMADKDKDADAKGADDKDDKKDKAAGKSGKSAKNDKEPQEKIYLLKTQKKAKLNGAEVLSLILQDVFTGKTETMFVPNSDPKGREYDPLPDVAAAVEALEDGAPVKVEAAKEKGKWMVSSLAKADVQPGEELPTGFVFVEYDENEDRAGNKTFVVTLRKFGREVKVGVPMYKNDDYKDANWEPDPKIDYEVRRLTAGEVVEAKIKPGRPPMLIELYRFYPPERGKFVKMKDTTFNGAAAAAFEMVATDGTTVTITLPGTEQARGENKVLMPDRRMLSAVKKLKPDTEIIVLYREDGQTMFLRDLRFPKGGDKPADAASGDKGKMKPEGDKDKPAGDDKGKAAAGDDEKKKDKK
jgi:hypothetical protein